METNSQVNDRQIVEGHLRECFGRVVYSHKTHEKCADTLLDRLGCIKVWQIILSSLTTAGFLSILFGTGQVGAAIGSLVSTVLLVLNAYTKSYDLGEVAQKHRSAAADLWLIREKYQALLADLRAHTRDLTAIIAERDSLLVELHNVYSGAPSTTLEAYQKAQKALKQLEDMTFSDEEIDVFLPNELKKITGRSNKRNQTD